MISRDPQLLTVSLENYKPFPRRETVEIRPLTFLIGKNSSGKSALARLPLLLARSLSDAAEAPLELQVEGIDFGASFVDLVHNRIPHGAVGVGARFASSDGVQFELWARIQHVSEYMLQVVAELELRDADRPPIVLKWQGQDPLAVPGRYTLNGSPVGVTFSGLFPVALSVPNPTDAVRQATDALFEGRRRLQHLFKSVAYLGPFREPAKRSYLFPGGVPQSVGTSGIDAAALLGADFLRRRGKVVDAVGRWFMENLGGWALAVARIGESFSVVLRSPDDPAVEVNLADAGTGLSQVLPLVVQRFLEPDDRARATLEIVEQPELHLHPAAQTTLADLYVRATQLERPPRFIIETHSENLLLRIRRRVAEGRLDPAKVVIYWVDDEQRPGSRVEPIFVTPDGGVTSWPKGVFAEDFDEVKAIRQAHHPQ